ncbi:MAG TPA: UDP-N-acetylmuramoyl-tripeptide--D-alanyl-D-alanine ligase [Kiritimatiellia bacterium]|nr:UDP-N-acetylmuramoyl-tripeptide--D-alanyl-D-alanine ligase [Kiritimatiellia bacterium]
MHARNLLDMDVKPSFDPTDVARWSGGVWKHIPARPVRGVSIDTRNIKDGDMFVAIRGENSDGHDFLDVAMARGASCVMVDDAERVNLSKLPALVVSSTRNALTSFARGYRNTWSCRVVAVTGSVGKTTVKELIADMLHHVGITARTRGNWNNDLGVPLSILSAPPDVQYGVFEVGMNHPGELEPLCDILRPDIGVVTCIGPVHIENFQDEEAIAREKAAVYRALAPDGVAVVNLDDRFSRVLIEYAGDRKVVGVSAKRGADIVYRRTDPVHGRFQLEEKSSGECMDCEAALPGEYFVIDSALAAATARAMGIGWPGIRTAIQRFRPLSMRWNREVIKGIHIINDAYNANPVSMRAAVHALLEEPTGGNRWVALGGMLELGRNERELHIALGEEIAGIPGLRLLTLGERGKWIADGAGAAGMDATHIYPAANADHAANFLFNQLKNGDTVLFKGSRGEAVDVILNKLMALWK